LHVWVIQGFDSGGKAVPEPTGHEHNWKIEIRK